MATVDPVSQAIMALCSHAGFVDGCRSCEARRTAAGQHLAALADSALRAVR